MEQTMMALLKGHLKTKRSLEFYDYQNKVAETIFTALIQNLNITRNATEEDVKSLKLLELAIEFSRQSGKTTCMVEIIAFIMIYFTQEFSRPIRIGIFAPQREQAKTDFDRLKASLRTVSDMTIKEQEIEDIDSAKEESNARTIVLPNGSSCYIFPVTSTSKPESKTLDLIIFEEAQDLEDRIVQQQIWPMGAATNAPRVYIGTAGTRLCHFRSLGLQEKALKLYFDDIAKQRRELYEKTGNIQHLVYEQTIRNEIENAPEGLQSDEIQRPYFGKWLIGTGQFTTIEELQGLESDRKYTQSEQRMECFAGIDTAKHPDSTVVTILRYNKELKKKELINWLELRGENYKNQFDIIIDFLGRYNIVALAIDSTGQGQFMPDWIKEETEWADENSGLYEIKFSSQTKDAMYRNLKVTIKDSLTTLPILSLNNSKRFVEQMVNLQQQYVGQYLKVNHPDDDKAHDDYSDSWALAEWAYAKWTEDSNDYVGVIDAREPQRKVSRDESGKITDYWPGLDEEL